MTVTPVRLAPRAIAKVWGATQLEPWHRDTVEKTGEIWLEHPQGFRLPVLVKFLYTSEALSVQVHPDDDSARQHGHLCGKTEMWVILRAAAGARIAHGLREPVTRDRLREAALSGEIERLREGKPVAAGAGRLPPAGVVHAIGPGLALCEIQQNSDVTYRLYDYGRPRPLEIEKAVEVAHLGPAPPPVVPARLGPGRELLACCEQFRVERLRLEAQTSLEIACNAVLIVLEGRGTVGSEAFHPGAAWLIPQDQRCAVRAADAATLLWVGLGPVASRTPLV